MRQRRSLGQTFLVDGNIANNIIEAAGISSEDDVVEIGAGAGALTVPLARKARRVVAIEIDRALTAILRDLLGDAIEIVQEDVLSLSWEQLLGPQRTGRWKLLANLPYSITGPAVMHALQARDWLARMVLMVQQEVAERITAPPGDRRRGLLSVMVQATTDVKLVARVSRTCFWPPPRVDSAVISMEVRRPPLLPAVSDGDLLGVLKAAFRGKRKTILNSLGKAPELGLSKPRVALMLDQHGIAQKLRAEDLSAQEFLCLTEAIRAAQQEQPH